MDKLETYFLKICKKKKKTENKSGNSKEKLIEQLCGCDKKFSSKEDISSCKTDMKSETIDSLKNFLNTTKQEGRFDCDFVKNCNVQSKNNDCISLDEVEKRTRLYWCGSLHDDCELAKKYTNFRDIQPSGKCPDYFNKKVCGINPNTCKIDSDQRKYKNLCP